MDTESEEKTVSTGSIRKDCTNRMYGMIVTWPFTDVTARK
jgi:hypothetical protein